MMRTQNTGIWQFLSVDMVDQAVALTGLSQGSSVAPNVLGRARLT